MAALDDNTDFANPLILLGLYIEKMRMLEKRSAVLNIETLEKYANLIILCDKQFQGQIDEMKIVDHALYIFNQCLTRWVTAQLPSEKLPSIVKVKLDLKRPDKPETKSQERKLLMPIPNVPDSPDPKKSWDETLTLNDVRMLRRFKIDEEVEKYKNIK